MGHISTSIDLRVPPERVFELAASPASFEKWLTIHTRWKGEVPETFTEGATISEVVTMMGMPNTITWTVDEYDVPNRVAISGIGMAGVKLAITIDVRPNGTSGATGATLELGAEFEGAMIVGALGKAIEKDGQKNLEQSLEQFKSLLGEDTPREDL